MTFAFIDDHKEQWPVRLMCDTLEVSPAGYYAWRERPPSFSDRRREALVVLIRGVHADVKSRYGSPRIHAELVARGNDCCVNTVAKLMHDNDIRAKTARKFRHTTDSNHRLPVAANVLDRQFDPEGFPTKNGWRTSPISRRGSSSPVSGGGGGSLFAADRGLVDGG